MEANGYTSSYFMSYRQIAELGGQVRKGEKATTVVYANRVTKQEENADWLEMTENNGLSVYRRRVVKADGRSSGALRAIEVPTGIGLSEFGAQDSGSAPPRAASRSAPHARWKAEALLCSVGPKAGTNLFKQMIGNSHARFHE